MAFWGLVLEPMKKYTNRVVENPFHISMAALDISKSDPNEEGSSVVLRHKDSNYVLCSLSKKRGVFNVPLNLDFDVGSEINFFVNGKSTVHLTGYILEDEMEGLESDDSLEEEEDEVEEKPQNDLFKKTKKLLEQTASKRKPDGSAENKAKKVKVDEPEVEDEEEDDSDFNMEDEDSDMGEEEEDDEEDEEEEDEDDDDEEAEKKEVVVPPQKKDEKHGKPNSTPKFQQNAQQGNKQKGQGTPQPKGQQPKGQATPQQNRGPGGAQPNKGQATPQNKSNVSSPHSMSKSQARKAKKAQRASMNGKK